MMIPPCDPSILEKNPQFKKLHQHLTGNLLNADGTTRADADSPERNSLAKELKSLQIRNAKRKIIRQAVRQIACLEAKSLDSRSDGGLSYNLRETSAVIATFLDAPSKLNEFEGAPEQERQVSLLNRDIQNFHENIHVFIPLLSDTISSWLTSLRSVADAAGSSTATTNNNIRSNVPAANQSRSRIRSRLSLNARKIQPPRLSTLLEQKISRLCELQISELPASRRIMAVTAASLLAARGEAMERMIVLLERAKHGALSRATKAHADYLATVAECMNNKVQVTKLETLSTIYTPESTMALKNYRTYLYEVQKSLEEKKTIASQTLEEFDQVGINRNNNNSKAAPGPMAHIARRYGDLAREVEVIQMEIKKLRYN